MHFRCGPLARLALRLEDDDDWVHPALRWEDGEDDWSPPRGGGGEGGGESSQFLQEDEGTAFDGVRPEVLAYLQARTRGEDPPAFLQARTRGEDPPPPATDPRIFAKAPPGSPPFRIYPEGFYIDDDGCLRDGRRGLGFYVDDEGD